jgi:branched-chain amino acid transport system permease protein
VATTSAWHGLWSITIAQTAPVLPYLLMVLMLMVRPRGLMGTRES